MRSRFIVRPAPNKDAANKALQDARQGRSNVDPNLAPPTQAETFNSACPATAFEADGWFYSNRLTSCYLYAIRISNGDAFVDFIYHQEVQHHINGGSDYQTELWLTPYESGGAFATGSGMSASLGCSAQCTSVDQLPFEQPFVKGRQLYGLWNISQPTAAMQFTVAIQQVHLTFSNPLGGPFNIDFFATLNTICDSGFPERGSTTGCVFRDTIGGYFLSVNDAEVDETAAHVRDAQQLLSGHPGRFGDGTPLNREGDPAVQTAHREAVCGSFVPQPGGSCDEYPFAATRQGGNPATTSIRDVNLDDNRRAGGRLGLTYQQQRILDGGPFWAVIS